MPEGKRPARDEFVNPYTFVQLPKGDPEVGWRTEPAGHDRLADGRFSGVLDVELTARSPLLLRNAYADSEGAFPRRAMPGFSEPVPYLPGSSLAGAVRSLHETLAGGCLRIFNGDFRPGYRDQVRRRPDGWRLVRVAEVDENGVPLRMERCPEEAVWVESAVLERALGGASQLKTGARVTLLGRGERKLDRQQLEDPSQVRGGGDWVVLLTHAGARRKDRKSPEGRGRLRGRYFCATGELEGVVRDVSFADGVWESFLDAVDDTDDMRRYRQDPSGGDEKPEWVDVEHPKDQRFMGRRIAARRRLYEDQVLWVLPEVTGATTLTVKDMALAVVWRHAGGVDKASQRVPKRASACRDPRQLCPSCRIFGSADTEGGLGDKGAEQRSYRGHLRFGDAIPREAYDTTREYLPPMGSPKPGAGQFYLNRSDGSEGKTCDEKNDRPLREWGSPGDGRGTRGLRGRKQYWLTGTHADRPYFRAREAKRTVFHEDLYEPGNKMLSEGESVRAGSVFTAQVRFENLDEAELGGLLCALDPALLLRAHDAQDPEAETPEYGWAVGGGRPLGFGTVTSRVTVTSLENAASRYLGEEPPSLSVEEAVSAFRRTASKELKDIWKRQLTKVLRLDWAEPHQVWYPPAGRLPEPGDPLNPEVLAPSFTFWKETTGGRAEDARFPYRQLPSAAAPSPTMRVIPQDKKEGR
ncbi:TIGR03986 family type III CRISPR-associated RAMP protein [Streptomyces albogriseolus]|uniref:TIGR03986 family type III CRISPR-associated RAMP protein n=1 Tax=Streptomyces albogriseolus TaxID=1887 RepID=UPI003850B10F